MKILVVVFSILLVATTFNENWIAATSTPMISSVVFSSLAECKAASTTLSYGGNCILNTTSTSLCQGNSLSFYMPSSGIGAACSWTNFQNAQSFAIRAFSTVSFFYSTIEQCNQSIATQINSCATHITNNCVTELFWSSTFSCSSCYFSSLAVDTIIGLVSASALGNC